MTDPRTRRLGAREWALLAGLLGVAALVYLLPLGARQVWSQDEARMALLAEDTLRHGPRLPARVRDQPYLNKPPFFFWSVALVAWPRGHVSDRDAPMASVGAALAMLLGAFLLGRRLSGPHAGYVALVVLATAPGFFLHGHEILPDPMFAAWLTWALYCLVGALGAARPQPAYLVGFYACVAGAFWTKGLPALLVVPATVAAALASGGVGALLRLRPLTGLAGVTMAVLPWVIPYAETPGAERSQAVGAAFSLIWYLDRYRHLSSVPFGDGLLVFLPWALWLVPAAVWWRIAPDRAVYRPVAAWMVVLLLLLGLSVQQRSRYLLPVYPIFALFVAASVTSGMARARPLLQLNVVIVCVLLAVGLVGGGWLCLTSALLPETLGDFAPSGRGERLLLVGLGVAAPALALWDLRAGRPPSRAVAWIAGALAVGLLLEGKTVPERLAREYPVRAFAERARAALDPGAPLRAYPDANLSFDLYLGRPVAELPAPEAATELLRAPALGGLLLREADWRRWRESAHASWCPVASATIGSRSFVLLGSCP